MRIEDLKQKCKEFKNLEGRASFYDVAKEIVDKHPLQASIVILATWNVSRFRFIASNPENLVNLEEAISKCEPLFQKVKGMEIQTADFNEIEGTVKEIYSSLSKVKGVEYTGASKVMHLLNRELFVMWDSYIRKHYGFARHNAEDYVEFLKKVQSEFRCIKWDDSTKTLAKAIDEYNYMTNSYPELTKKKSPNNKKRRSTKQK